MGVALFPEKDRATDLLDLLLPGFDLEPKCLKRRTELCQSGIARASDRCSIQPVTGV